MKYVLIALLLFGLFPATAFGRGAKHCSHCGYILNPMTELSGIASKYCPQCGDVLKRDPPASMKSHDLNTESNGSIAANCPQCGDAFVEKKSVITEESSLNWERSERFNYEAKASPSEGEKRIMYAGMLVGAIGIGALGAGENMAMGGAVAGMFLGGIVGAMCADVFAAARLQNQEGGN